MQFHGHIYIHVVEPRNLFFYVCLSFLVRNLLLLQDINNLHHLRADRLSHRSFGPYLIYIMEFLSNKRVSPIKKEAT